MAKVPVPPKDPLVIKVNGETYHLVLFMVHTKHPEGQPALVKMMLPDATPDLEGSEEFMGAYVHESVLKARKKKKGDGK